MPTGHTSQSGKTTARRSASSGRSTTAAKRPSAATSRGGDAVSLLKADHREVERLFGQFEKARDESRKQQLARRICLELRVHSQIEEELVYPTARAFLKDDEIVNEALVEHQAAKDLIEQIESMTPPDEMFEAKLLVLKEQIEHHVQEEETQFFPQIQKTEMDLKGVGDQLRTRKAELMGEMGGDVPSTH